MLDSKTVRQIYANNAFPKLMVWPESSVLQSIAGMTACNAFDVPTKEQDDIRLFWFCHTQCAAFGGATYTAIEISQLTGLPALWIASLIAVHGADWQTKALVNGIASASMRKRVSSDQYVVPVFGQISTVRLLCYTHSLPKQNVLAVFNNASRDSTLGPAFSALVQAQAKSIWLRSSISSTRMRLELGLRPAVDDETKPKKQKPTESGTGVLDEDFNVGVL